jgi:hypothetical protein
MADWISLVETAYELDGDLTAWLDAVTAQAAPLLDRGCGVVAHAFKPRPGAQLLAQ